MADAYRIHDWLQLPRCARAGLSKAEAAIISEAVLQILQAHAPGIAALAGNAPWDAGMQAAVQAALHARFADSPCHDDAWNLVCSVIANGRHAGLWDHAPWARRHRVLVAPSALKRSDIDALRRADGRGRCGLCSPHRKAGQPAR